LVLGYKFEFPRHTPSFISQAILQPTTKMLFSSLITGLVALCTTVQSAAVGTDHQLIKRASLTQVTNFGTNPSNVKMFIYAPQKLHAKPPVVLVLHACGWTANKFFATTKYGQLADQHGYVLIYGQTPTDGACWDVSSKESLTHDGGSDSTGLANMVRYALKKYNGDASKVYVTGESSGAMMTVSPSTRCGDNLLISTTASHVRCLS
jgi:acetylxylan esterase